MIKPPHSYNLVLLEDGFKKQKKKGTKTDKIWWKQTERALQQESDFGFY